MVSNVEWMLLVRESCLATVYRGLTRHSSSWPRLFGYEHQEQVVRGDVQEGHGTKVR